MEEVVSDVPCPWPALSRCLAGSASHLEEQRPCHRGGGDPGAPPLVSEGRWRPGLAAQTAVLGAQAPDHEYSLP